MTRSSISREYAEACGWPKRLAPAHHRQGKQPSFRRARREALRDVWGQGRRCGQRQAQHRLQAGLVRCGPRAAHGEVDTVDEVLRKADALAMQLWVCYMHCFIVRTKAGARFRRRIMRARAGLCGLRRMHASGAKREAGRSGWE